MDSVTVTFLGSGDAFNPQGRHHAGYVIQWRDTVLLMDCGATALASLNRCRIAPASIGAIIISHFHGDHFCGIPFLFLQYLYRDRRSRPLSILGPSGVKDRVTALYRATYGSTADEPLPFEVRYRELLPDRAEEVDAARIQSFLAPHQPDGMCLGFALAIADRKIVYSGDSGWTEEIVRQAQGADLFICECSFFDSRFPFHLDYRRIQENRERIQCRRMILTHLGEEVLQNREKIDLEIAEDGLRIQL
jgi:ribonuclease BN (tRNA processing enzyme)